jgi:hypothetical protein
MPAIPGFGSCGVVFLSRKLQVLVGEIFCLRGQAGCLRSQVSPVAELCSSLIKA